MQITEHIHAKRMYFKAVTPAGVMKRNVFVYLITGDHAPCLIDAGVASSVDDVLDFIADAGAGGKSVSEILITHAHVDHIGGLAELKCRLGCPAAASEKSAPWIEDIDIQFRQRPVPQFYDFVKRSAVIERRLSDGDEIDLGGHTLVVYEAPGHEKGQLAFYSKEDGVLLSADSIPVLGEMPVYEDLSAEINTLRRLDSIENVNTLLASWDDPCEGAENVHRILKNAMDYVRLIHTLTQEGLTNFGADNVVEVARYVHNALDLPASTFNLLFTNTIQAHIKEHDLEI